MVNKNFFKFGFGFLVLISAGISAIVFGEKLGAGEIEAVRFIISGFFR